MKTKTDCIVVGGGIGGLAVAYSLARFAGRKVTVLEQAPQFSEIGAGLQLGPNALRMLDYLGVLEEVYKYSVFPRRHVFMDAIDGKELSPVNFSDQFKEKYDYPYLVIHRSDLHSVLLEACQSTHQVETLTNHRVIDVQQDEKAAYVTCENGAQFSADIVIGADGLWSNVRKLVSDDEPVCSSFVAYRGTVPMSEMKVDIDWDENTHGSARVSTLSSIRSEINKSLTKWLFLKVKISRWGRRMGTPEELDEAYSKCWKQLPIL